MGSGIVHQSNDDIIHTSIIVVGRCDCRSLTAVGFMSYILKILRQLYIHIMRCSRLMSNIKIYLLTYILAAEACRRLSIYCYNIVSVCRL